MDATRTNAPRIRDETPEIAARPANFTVIAALPIRPVRGPANIQPACAFVAQGPAEVLSTAPRGDKGRDCGFLGDFGRLVGNLAAMGDESSCPDGSLAFATVDE
jgi:hypothetical protein